MKNKETSAGAIIYKIINNELFILIEHMTLGHYSLVKGHLEGNETLEEASLREIKEETSLDVSLDNSFKYMISYAPYKEKPEIIKDVYFFIAKVQDIHALPIDLHDNEVSSLEFLKEIDSINILTYDNDRDALKEAIKYIKRKEKLI